MPLFKIVPLDRSKRILVKGSTVTEVKDSAKTKLSLPDGNYKITLEEDGTEIDDDEILMAMAETVKGPTSLMILSEDMQWSEPVTAVLKEVGGLNSGNEATTSSRVSLTTSNLAMERPITFGSNLWEKMPQSLMECCEKGLRAHAVDRRTMVGIIARYMVDELKDTTRRTAERIAQFIIEKYPKSFADNIGDQVIGAGMESLRSQVYNAVNYRKNDKLITRKRPPIGAESDEENIPSESESRKPRNQDEYGCVDYQPLLPSTESTTSQKEKQKLLMELVQLVERHEEKVAQLIDDTYPSQRIAINAK